MYQWNPQDYSEHSANQEKWAHEVMGRLTLRGDERILDIGSGDGKVTAELVRRVPRGSVVGVDVSPEMVRFAQEKFPARNFPRLLFRQADASALPFRDEFDWAVSFTCLHWVRDHVPVLEGVRRSLKPGGRVFLQFGGKGMENVILEMSEPVMAAPRWSPYFSGFLFPWFFYDAEEYKPWVEKAGLTLRRVELKSYEGVFTEQKLKGWVRSTWVPYTQRLPPSLREAFVSEVVGRCARKHAPDRHGVIRLVFKRLEVEAEKD